MALTLNTLKKTVSLTLNRYSFECFLVSVILASGNIINTAILSTPPFKRVLPNLG